MQRLQVSPHCQTSQRCVQHSLTRRHGAGCASQAKGKVKKLTEKLQNHDLESQPGRTLMESFESQVRAAHCLPALLQRLVVSGTRAAFSSEAGFTPSFCLRVALSHLLVEWFGAAPTQASTYGKHYLAVLQGKHYLAAVQMASTTLPDASRRHALPCRCAEGKHYLA